MQTIEFNISLWALSYRDVISEDYSYHAMLHLDPSRLLRSDKDKALHVITRSVHRLHLAIKNEGGCNVHVTGLSPK